MVITGILQVQPIQMYGNIRPSGVTYLKGDKGDDGRSAYEVACDEGFSGTCDEWLASLQGAPGEQGSKGDSGEAGPQGIPGPQGPAGQKGDAGEQGLTGSKGEKGEQGVKGDKGEQGIQGPAGTNGSDGYTPVRGTDYWTPEDITTIENELKTWTETEILGGSD